MKIENFKNIHFMVEPFEGLFFLFSREAKAAELRFETSVWKTYIWNKTRATNRILISYLVTILCGLGNGENILPQPVEMEQEQGVRSDLKVQSPAFSNEMETTSTFDVHD